MTKNNHNDILKYSRRAVYKLFCDYKGNLMSLKNKEEQFNEPTANTANRVYFFDDRAINDHIKHKDRSASKKLKSSKPIRYSTVFKVSKEEIAVSEEPAGAGHG